MKIKLSGGSLAWMLLFCLVSCQKVTPQEDPGKNKGHEDPAKIYFILKQGELRDADKNNVYAYDFVADDKKADTCILVTTKDFNTEIKGHFSVKNGVWYHLHISFENRAGVNINEQFSKSPEMRLIHQFIFRPFKSENGTDIIKNTDSSIFEYRYGDKINGEPTEGIGFDGYIKFKSGADFYLNIILLHITVGTKISGNGQIQPFHGYYINPKTGKEEINRFLKGVTDVNTRLKIKIESK